MKKDICANKLNCYRNKKSFYLTKRPILKVKFHTR